MAVARCGPSWFDSRLGCRGHAGMMIRDRLDDDIPWMRALLLQRWGGTIMVMHGDQVDVMALPALVAGERAGLATYRVTGDEAELVSLDAVEPGRGIGTKLVSALAARLKQDGVRR